MDWSYFLTRSDLWLFFMVTGVTAQTIPDSSRYSNEKEVSFNSEAISKENLFDFWIGEWNVCWSEKNGKIGKGTNVVEYILDSTAIQEDFEVSQGLLEGFKGRSLSIFKSDIKQWKQVWVDNKGGYFEFTGKVNHKLPIFETDVVERNDKEYKYRMIFKNIETTSLTWDWEVSPDKGETWQLKWRIFYFKKTLP